MGYPIYYASWFFICNAQLYLLSIRTSSCIFGEFRFKLCDNSGRIFCQTGLVSGGGQYILVGNDWHIYCFDIDNYFMAKKIQTLNSKDGYNKVAKEYKKLHSYLFEFEKNKAISMLGNIENKKVLDAGAGSGRLIKQLVNAQAIVTAMDISENMLKAIRKDVLDNVKIVVGDVEEMPFENNSFDIVISTFVIVHLKDPSIFFQEAYRILKDGGRLLIGNINQREPVPILTPDGLVQIDSYYHGQEDVIRELEQVGFRIERQEIITENSVWINQLILASK